MASRSSYRGVNKLRRLLRKIDPEAQDLVKDALKDGAQAIETDMLIGAPVNDGDLQQSISHKFGRDGLSAYIGPGADRANIQKLGFSQSKRRYTKSGNLTKATIADDHARFQLYKAHWYEHGTKPRDGHPGQPARPFINPAYDANSGWIKRELRSAIDEALRTAARG